MSRRSLTLLSLLAALALIAGACGAGGSEGASAYPAASAEVLPLQVMMGREVVQFESIEQGTAAADTVGRFIVRDVVEGKHGQLVTYTVTVDRIEVLAGDPLPDSSTIVTDAAYWRPEFLGTNRDWLRSGGEVLLLLVRRSDTGALRPLNSQSIYRVDAQKTLGIWEGPVTSRFDGAPLAELRSAVLEAP